MIPKIHKLVKGKKPSMITLRLILDARGMRHSFYRYPSSITIGTRGLTQEQISLFKELEATKAIPPITWIVSSPEVFDDVMRVALWHLHSEKAEEMGCKMRYGYDYAWIKIALDRGKIPTRYTFYSDMSTPKFVDYIKSLGFTDIAGSKTLNKLIAQATWISKSNMLTFPGYYIPIKELNRRNLIIQKFLEIMNEI